MHEIKHKTYGQDTVYYVIKHKAKPSASLVSRLYRVLYFIYVEHNISKAIF